MFYCKIGKCDYDRKLCCKNCNRKRMCEHACDVKNSTMCNLKYENKGDKK